MSFESPTPNHPMGWLPTNLLFIRHGQSEENLAEEQMRKDNRDDFMRLIMDVHTSELRLTDLGARQAEWAALWLESEYSDGFDLCVTSPYVRALETAAIISSDDSWQWWVDLRVAEMNWGSAAGTTMDTRSLGQEARELARMDRDGMWWAPGGGESQSMMLARLQQFLDSLRRPSPLKNVIVVCHGGVMSAMRLLVENMTPWDHRAWATSKNPKDYLSNCQIMHYQCLPWENEFFRMRMVRPLDEEFPEDDWHKIQRQNLFGRNDLWTVVKQHPARIRE